MVATRRDGLTVEAVHDEVLVFNPGRSEATALNESAALVFDLCDGDHTIDDIKHTFDAAGLGPATDDAVWLALGELADADLIDLHVPRASHRSRRELIKQFGVGAAALAALPVVETISAPSAATAGSPGVSPTVVTPAPTTAPTPGTTTTTTEATPAPTTAPTTTTTEATPAPTTAPTTTTTEATPAPTTAPTTTTTQATPTPVTASPTSRPTTSPTPRPTTSRPTTSPSVFAEDD